MVPHLDTVCVIHDLERQHRLAEASRVHRLLPPAATAQPVVRLPAVARTGMTVLRGLTSGIKLRTTVANGPSS